LIIEHYWLAAASASFTTYIYKYSFVQDENIYRDLIASTNDDEPITDTQQVFPDTESRVKSSSWTNLSSSKGDSNEQQNNAFNSRLIPSAVLPLPKYEQLSSSKDDEQLTFSDMSTMGQHLSPREKRFLFANKDQLVVKSTITTFSFFTAVSTVTRNLLNPPPAAQCQPVAAANVPQCVACLPAGYVVCPATG
jgi:hypothetical protein